MMDQISEGKSGVLKRWWDFVKFLASLVAIIAVLYGATNGLQRLIQSEVRKPEVLEMIAARVRPSVIIDSRGSILADMGAMQFLEEIEVRPGDDESLPSEIIVSPKKHMPSAPILTSLDPIFFSAEVERGRGLAWAYKLKWHGQVAGIEVGRFRIELTSKSE